jgi:Flp pilus assembly CpaF family ATPase
MEDNDMLYGWSLAHQLSHFQTVADNLEKEGQTSRANTIRYLVERCERAELNMKPTQAVLLDDDEINEVMDIAKGNILLAIQNTAKKQHPKSVRAERKRILDYLDYKYGNKGRGACLRSVNQIAKELCLELVLKDAGYCDERK